MKHNSTEQPETKLKTDLLNMELSLLTETGTMKEKKKKKLKKLTKKLKKSLTLNK